MKEAVQKWRTPENTKPPAAQGVSVVGSKMSGTLDGPEPCDVNAGVVWCPFD
jgi:hypothetical protein